ncbi:hypothetical protein CC86DRAFT_400001 [Ophiobolus disseminans]|uniref:Uncharacterized protein n=1 Tax=Ophiobolus disseminans TaxID=1469910 RepID=A0A6A7ALA0_9PLEO|nr:hypothetical protein CC86DRAFT_400001 [Ophiobolus disseminans]
MPPPTTHPPPSSPSPSHTPTSNHPSVYCQTTNLNGTRCTHKALRRNAHALQTVSAALSRQPIDEVSDHAIHGLPQYSLCFTHRDKTNVVARKWQKMLAAKIRSEWRKERHRVRALRAELDAVRAALRAREGEIVGLEEDLVKARSGGGLECERVWSGFELLGC